MGDIKLTAGEDLEHGDMIVMRADGKCYKATPGEPDAFPFTPAGVGYAAIRIKASEPLACPECGTTNNLTHADDCAIFAALDDDDAHPFTVQHPPTMAPAAMKEMMRTMPDRQAHVWRKVVLGRIPASGVVETTDGRRFLIEDHPEPLIGTTTTEGHFTDGVVTITVSAPSDGRLSSAASDALEALGKEMVARFRALRDPKPAPQDEGVHRAISAMQSGAANRKANDL